MNSKEATLKTNSIFRRTTYVFYNSQLLYLLTSIEITSIVRNVFPLFPVKSNNLQRLNLIFVTAAISLSAEHSLYYDGDPLAVDRTIKAHASIKCY